MPTESSLFYMYTAALKHRSEKRFQSTTLLIQYCTNERTYGEHGVISVCVMVDDILTKNGRHFVEMIFVLRAFLVFNLESKVRFSRAENSGKFQLNLQTLGQILI